MRQRHIPSIGKQRGAALMALLALVVAGSAFLLVQKLNAASVQIDRDAMTRKSLLQAKQALLAFAALDNTASSQMNRPGSLPCPARPLSITPRENWGNALTSCGTVATRVGRLPWKTLDLPELTDGSGEYLWYVLSPRFRDAASSEINGDTRGQIQVLGAAGADEVVAVIFAPGAPVKKADNSPQDRSTLALADQVANYLEDYVLDPNAALSTITDQFKAGPATDKFNDQFITITQEELMAATENVVAARLRTLILPRLRQYYTDWGAFPYAAPFNPTDTVLDAKVMPLTQGMLPLAMSGATMSLSWKSTFYEIKNGVATVGTCTAASATVDLVCDIAPPIAASVTLTVEINDVGFGLVEPIQQGGVSPIGTVSPQTFTGSLQANGTGTVVASFTVNSSIDPVQIRFALPQKTSMAGFKYDWLILNRWYQQVLYSIPPNMAPGGGSTCSTTAAASCLTIQRRDATSATASVALVLAGRPAQRETPPAGCTIQKRPAWDPNSSPGCAEALGPANYLQNYFESLNNDGVTTLPITLKEGYRSPAFNDRVVWLSAFNATPAAGRPNMECAPWLCE